MSYLDIKFQWYKNGIKTIKPGGYITLRQLIESIKSPTPEMVETFKLIEQAGARGDKAEKDRLKTEKLFFTTPSAIFDPIRNYESVKDFLPLAVFEYDNIEYAEELRDYIFEKRKDCIFAFMSPSKTGCKFIFLLGKTPDSIEEYKELWLGIAYDLDKFRELDMSNLRLTQPLFNSYDSDAKFREDAIGSVVRGFKTNSFQPFSGEIEVAENVSEEDKQECLNTISFLIDRIVDCAHNQVLSSSFLGGGFVAFYGIDQDEMWNLIEGRIRDNDYMKKGTEGYLKTAHTMFHKGLQFPKELLKDK